MQKTEIWKVVPGFDGVYEVSDLGRVRSRARGQLLLKVARPNVNGYPSVRLCKNNASYHRTVHRLVMLAFHGEPPPYHEVNHLDCDKANPRLDNLEYVTKKQNMEHAIKMGRMTGPQFVGGKGRHHFRGKVLGEKQWAAKLNAEKVRDIHNRREGGESVRSLSEEYGVHQDTIRLTVYENVGSTSNRKGSRHPKRCA